MLVTMVSIAGGSLKKYPLESHWINSVRLLGTEMATSWITVARAST